MTDALPTDAPPGVAGSDDAEPVSAVSSVAALYEERRLGLVRLARQLVDDLATAEDVVQDIFLRLTRSGIADIEDMTGYLRTAVINGARSTLRRRLVRRRTPTDPLVPIPPVDEAAIRKAEHARVLAAVDALPRRQREILVLRYYQDLSLAETAAALGISVGAVTSSAAVGLKKVQHMLDDHGSAR